MRRITKFFLFLLVGLSLAGCVLNFGGLYLLHNSSSDYNKRDLRHWLSLQARVEALEDAAEIFTQDGNHADTESGETVASPEETQVRECDTCRCAT